MHNDKLDAFLAKYKLISKIANLGEEIVILYLYFYIFCLVIGEQFPCFLAQT